MQEIIVTNQAELDLLPIDFNGRIIIKFGTPWNWAVLNRKFMYPVEAWENSSVVAWGNSSVVAWGNSSVEAWGNSSVEARGNSSVVARGNSQICDCTINHNIETSGNARIVYNYRNIDEYCEHYSVERNGDTLRLFKAVHKRDNRYFSDNDHNFQYVVGEVAVADRLDNSINKDCGHGIHMAYKEWCADYGKNWKDLAILEVEAEASGIIVPVPGCGKVRAAQAKVIREVPLEECGLMGKILAKRRSNDGT